MVEKPPFEKQNTTKQEQDKDNPAILELNGLELKSEKKHFEYPESIQKETGIIGYERTIIDKDDLFSLIKKNYYDSDYSKYKEYSGVEVLDLDKVGIYDLESLAQHLRKTESHGVVEKEKNLAEDMLTSKLDSMAVSKAINSLLLNLSDGEYPAQTLNHQLGVYKDRETKDEYLKKFVEDKLFLQKIYDLDYIKKRVEHYNDKEVFSGAPLEGDPEQKSNICIFDKEAGQVITNKAGSEDAPRQWLSWYAFPIRELANPEYYQGIKDGKLFAATSLSGINVSLFDFFFSGRTSNPAFGFSVKDNLFKNYLNKSLDIYTKGCKGINFNALERAKYLSPDHYVFGVESTLCALLLSEGKIDKLMPYDLHNDPKDGYDSYKDYCIALGDQIESALKNIENEHQIKLGDYLSYDTIQELKWNEPNPFNSKSTPREDFNPKNLIKLYSEFLAKHIRGLELHLPVFIGRDDIPQLSWGHAAFSHFVSSKGLNFIKFKHSDNLPK
jgi:hypothetical protein